VQAQGVRDHTRKSPRATKVTEAQASDLTLTLTSVAVRPVQIWVRTAGAIDTARKVVTVHLAGTDAMLVKVGQRARTFPVESRSSMYQARVVRVIPEGKGIRVDLELAAVGWPTTKGYVVEIVTDHGELLSVPNEALIEEGETRVVYRQSADGQYEPTPVQTGVQGEIYTQVTGGLKDGDQVVTFGSFFIDSEFKLKGAAQGQK
jgi:Cu(I)/Ag(I) efflux system membrane fusion protein